MNVGLIVFCAVFLSPGAFRNVSGALLLQAVLAETIHTHLYPLNLPGEGVSQMFGVDSQTPGTQAVHPAAAGAVKMRMRRMVLVGCETVIRTSFKAA